MKRMSDKPDADGNPVVIGTTYELVEISSGAVVAKVF